ncbi:hypothetical protein VT84_23660 [Gemmata sp. SH-PL17]|nr:hypothetical protein [Gemmata sp. SH-PL17]AMV27417.1 hypothetical protein VT84_23660 [Gemmata sp. SH-PL17]
MIRVAVLFALLIGCPAVAPVRFAPNAPREPRMLMSGRRIPY